MQGSHIAFLSLSSFWGGVGGEFGQATPKSKLIFQHTVSVKLEMFKNGTECGGGKRTIVKNATLLEPSLVRQMERFGITCIGMRNLPNSYHWITIHVIQPIPTLQGPSDLQHRPPKVPDQTIANSTHISSDGGLDHQRQLGRLPPHEEARVT